MKRISEYAADVESAIREMALPGGELETLYAPITYGMEAGGKRLRPVLLLMSADAFGEDSSKAIKAAVGIELFHNFTLLHDDVMDKSDIRRGRPTVCRKYDDNAAILSGDTMLTLATEYISEVPDSILRKVLYSFTGMSISVYEGQRLDMDFETSAEVGMDSYIRMVTDKTGALLGASAEIGSLIGGASHEESIEMYKFGELTGVAFQIQDDYLDTFGDPATFGKAIGGDILNGKKTFLYVAAMKKGGEDAEALRNAYGLPAGPAKVNVVRKIYEKMGIDKMCREAVAHYSSQALKALNSTSLGHEQKEAFRQFAEKLIGRKK